MTQKPWLENSHGGQIARKKEENIANCRQKFEVPGATADDRGDWKNALENGGHDDLRLWSPPRKNKEVQLGGKYSCERLPINRPKNIKKSEVTSSLGKEPSLEVKVQTEPEDTKNDKESKGYDPQDSLNYTDVADLKWSFLSKNPRYSEVTGSHELQLTHWKPNQKEGEKREQSGEDALSRDGTEKNHSEKLPQHNQESRAVHTCLEVLQSRKRDSKPHPCPSTNRSYRGFKEDRRSFLLQKGSNRK